MNAPVTSSIEFEQLRPLPPESFQGHTTKDFLKALETFRHFLHPGYGTFTHEQENVILSICDFEDCLYLAHRDKYTTTTKRGPSQGVQWFALQLLAAYPKLNSEELADACRAKFPTAKTGKASGAYYRSVAKKLAAVEAYVKEVVVSVKLDGPVLPMPATLHRVPAKLWTQVVRNLVFASKTGDVEEVNQVQERVIGIIRRQVPHLNTTDDDAKGYGWSVHVPGA